MTKLNEGIDLELAELGLRLREAEMLRREAVRVIKKLEAEQRARIDKIMRMRHLEFTEIEDGRRVLKTELLTPSEHQRQALDMFEQVLTMDDPVMLKRVYEMAVSFHCQFTTWKSEFGENLDVAYAARAHELADAQESVA